MYVSERIKKEQIFGAIKYQVVFNIIFGSYTRRTNTNGRKKKIKNKRYSISIRKDDTRGMT